MTTRQLAPKPHIITPTLVRAVELWADAKTSATSRRRHDILRDKQNALLGDGKDGRAAGFFVFVGKHPDAITPLDVDEWRAYLETMGLAATTVYARVSRVSSFYKWLMGTPQFRDIIRANPVEMVRPKAPQPYQTEKARALSDEHARALLAHVAALAAKPDNISAKRDYALLRLYFATGKRRDEIIRLRWRDVEVQPKQLVLHTEEKGGLYRATAIRDSGVRAALWGYFRASDRWDAEGNAPALEPSAPLWLRHDRAAQGQQPVTSHGFVYMVKRYAKAAGLPHFHLHQTRHTVARIVGEHSGDLTDVQTVLGHQSIQTTRVYLDRVAVKRDKHSEHIAERLVSSAPEEDDDA